MLWSESSAASHLRPLVRLIEQVFLMHVSCVMTSSLPSMFYLMPQFHAVKQSLLQSRGMQLVNSVASSKKHWKGCLLSHHDVLQHPFVCLLVVATAPLKHTNRLEQSWTHIIPCLCWLFMPPKHPSRPSSRCKIAF